MCGNRDKVLLVLRGKKQSKQQIVNMNVPKISETASDVHVAMIIDLPSEKKAAALPKVYFTPIISRLGNLCQKEMVWEVIC